MSHSPRRCALLVCAALLLGCTACGSGPILPGSFPSSAVSTVPGSSAPISPLNPLPDTPPSGPSAPVQPLEPLPAPVPSDSSDPEPTDPDPPADPPFQPDPAGTEYDFSQPVPESPPVDNSYFADAAFIGDSRTDGFLLFSGVKTGKNLTANGLSIFHLSTKQCISVDGTLFTPLEALAQAQYGKVYLSLGINELGYRNDQGFYRAYCDAIDAIRACQPGAVIYIQALIPLNEEKIAATGGRDYLENDHLRVYNDLMRQVAEEKQVVFLDLYSAFAVDGSLPYDASNDGVHLTGDYYKQWLAYLKCHTVDLSTLYPNGSPQSTPAPQPDAPSAHKPASEVIPL